MRWNGHLGEKMIDYKGGTVVWDNSYNWELDDYDYNQDILQVKYGQHIVIDVGDYTDGQGGRHFTIMVIDFSSCSNEDEMAEMWCHPKATFSSKDRGEMLLQLQHAIDTYGQPNL
jgi:hypothetical protein